MDRLWNKCQNIIEKETRFHNQDKTVMVADSSKDGKISVNFTCTGISNSYLSTSGWCTPDYEYRVAWPRHNKGTNILFMDGHVEWSKKEKIVGNPNIFWDVN